MNRHVLPVRHRLSSLALALAIGLLGGTPNTVEAGLFDSVLSFIPLPDKSGEQNGETAAPTNPDKAQPAQPASTAKLFKSPPARVRPEASMNALFSKRTVNGRELLDEIRTIRQAANAARSERAFSSLMGAIDSSASQLDASRFDIGSLLKNVGMSLLSETRSSVSYAALNSFFDTLTGDPDALARESIELPSPDGMDLAQRQRILNMAALVVGARAANKIADDAKKTFDNLEDEYEKLLRQREKIAYILADVVDKRRKAMAARDELAMREMNAELARYLSKEDLAFIDSFGADRPLKEFAGDFGMQNVALEFLRRQDPKAYADYRARSDELVGRTKAYVKTVGGILAFGGLLSGFSNEVALSAKDKNAKNILSMLPLGVDFLGAALPLMAKNVSASFSGVALASTSFIDIFSGEPLFRVVAADGSSETYRKASGVFTQLRDKGEGERFQEALFRNGSGGLLHQIYLCDAEATGRMLDGTVKDETRKALGKVLLRLPEGESFYFLNAMTRADLPQRNKLVSEVLASDQRQHARLPEAGQAQREVSEKYAEWNASQLARLILANHQGPITHAQMQVGDMLVRMIPSMTAVYEYETYADGCRAAARRG